MTIHMNEQVLVLLLTYRPNTFCGHVRICFEDQCTLVALPRAISQPLSASISSSVPHTPHHMSACCVERVTRRSAGEGQREVSQSGSQAGQEEVKFLRGK